MPTGAYIAFCYPEGKCIAGALHMSGLDLGIVLYWCMWLHSKAVKRPFNVVCATYCIVCISVVAVLCVWWCSKCRLLQRALIVCISWSEWVLRRWRHTVVKWPKYGTSYKKVWRFYHASTTTHTCHTVPCLSGACLHIAHTIGACRWNICLKLSCIMYPIRQSSEVLMLTSGLLWWEGIQTKHTEYSVSVSYKWNLVQLLHDWEMRAADTLETMIPGSHGFQMLLPPTFPSPPPHNEPHSLSTRFNGPREGHLYCMAAWDAG